MEFISYSNLWRESRNGVITFELVNQLTSNPDLNFPTENDLTPLQIAIHKNNFDVFKLLVSIPKIDLNHGTS